MENNPELHYLNHVQNTSMSKHCVGFAKAPRFQQHRRMSTDFKYNPKQMSISRSCSFGFGNRSNLPSIESNPSPNKYDVSKFPVNHRTTSLGFSRDQAIFGTITVQIKQKSKLPAPGTYQSVSSLKNKKFTLRKRLKTQFDVNKKQTLPGPGEYQPLGINQQGKYPVSTIKNVRHVFVDSYKPDINPKLNKAGPGTYDVLRSSSFSIQNIKKMKSTTCKPFGTQKRKGPEEAHRLSVPGPGIYDSFSAFGNRQSLIKSRNITQY